MVERRGGRVGRRGRTSALAEGGRGEPVGPRQGASRVEERVVGYAGIIHHPRRREACANTPPYHTARPMVVEGCGGVPEEVAGHPRGTIGFGGDPEAEYTDTSGTDPIAALHVAAGAAAR